MSKKSKIKPCKGKNPPVPINQQEKTVYPGFPIEPQIPGTIGQVTGICLLLVAMVCAVYGQTRGHAFVTYDDNFDVYNNPTVTKGLTFDGVLKAFTHKDSGLWNPLVTISHMLDCQLFGLWAGGHHLTNVLLHLVSAIFLFLILRQMTGTLWRSALVAALFAVHPIRVESVAWVAERKDVLSGFFFILTLGSYLRYVRRPESWGRYLITILVYILGLMSKPMLVTLPFLLLLLDYWPLNRLFRNGKITVDWKVVREKIPLFFLAGALCVITIEGKHVENSGIDTIPFLTRIGLAPVWLVTYLGQMIWPIGLAVIYPHPEALLFWFPWALLLWGSLTPGCFLLRKKHPYLWMGWLWNFGMLVPALGIIQISRHSQADHYNYLPQIGLYIALVWFIAAFSKERSFFPDVLKTGAAVVLAFLMIVSFHQTSTWRDSITLWNYTIASTRDNFVAHNNLGFVLSRHKQTEGAIAEYREALRLKPDYAEGHNSLAMVLYDQGHQEEAIAHLREALRLNPNYAEGHNSLGTMLYEQGHKEEAIAHVREALRLDPDYAEAHNNLGLILSAEKQTAAAIAEYREALRLNLNDSELNYRLGLLLVERGDLFEATREFKAALNLKPLYPEALENLANILFQQGRVEEAISFLRQSLQINPGSASNHNNLGVMLKEYGQVAGGIAEFREALKINPNYPDALNNLGSALFLEGKTDEAIAQYREALRINPTYAKVHVNLGNCLIKKGELKEAISHFGKALELQSNNTALQNTLAWTLATSPQTSLRNGKRALQLATLANQATGNNNPFLLRTLAAAYAQTANFPKAITTTKTALQLAQGQASLTEALQHDLSLYQSGKTLGEHL